MQQSFNYSTHVHILCSYFTVFYRYFRRYLNVVTLTLVFVQMSNRMNNIPIQTSTPPFLDLRRYHQKKQPIILVWNNNIYPYVKMIVAADIYIYKFQY